MTVLAADIGATRIKLGLVQDGRVMVQKSISSQSDQSLANRLPEIATVFRQLCASHGIAIEKCRGISLSVPSLVEAASGRILAEYGRFRDMPGLDLRRWAKTEFELPLAIENDARMATIGEWRYGAGRNCEDLVMVTLGTGLGSSAVIEGRVLRGKHGQAGCLGGHLTLRYGGRPCGCGNLGCAEAEASTAFLAHTAKDRPDFMDSSLSSEPTLDYSAVFRHASFGDACACEIRDHSILVWSSLVVSLIHAYDPELVILGGGVMRSVETILPAVKEFVHEHAHSPWGKVRVVASLLGDTAALVAGEWLVEEQLRYYS